MKNFLNKTMLVKGGLLMSALTIAAFGFAGSTTKQVNDQAVIKLRNVSRVGNSATFELNDALALVSAETVKCGESTSGCSVTYNGEKTVIKGKKE